MMKETFADRLKDEKRHERDVYHVRVYFYRIEDVILVSLYVEYMCSKKIERKIDYCARLSNLY